MLWFFVGLTGPPWLYQVDCHLRTLRDPRFRGRWSEAKGPMRPHLVIMLSPAFHEHLHLPECSKQFSIQQFVA